MRPFDTLFPDIAAAECRALQPISNPDLPAGTFLFRELYCTDPRCDCRRALLQIWWAERKQVAATINYAFEPASPPFDDEPQIFLDPLNPQSDLSDGLRDLFEEMIANDPTYRDRLVRHYEMWKAVVDDPSHPDHRKVRSDHHDDPGFLPAFRASASASASASREPPPTAPKVGLNAPCPCGSGRKYKKCCRR